MPRKVFLQIAFSAGLGDRRQQNGVNYTLDLNTGLTQILADGTNTYLYGNGRISQHITQTEYFLGDALGSVRQLADTAGAVTLTQSYAPYGDVVSSVGTSQTSYAFTGESSDSYIKLIYLRSRYYAPETGRFLTKDSWQGDYKKPLSLNRWGYVEGNPVNFVDPTGRKPEWCQSMPNKAMYEFCIGAHYKIEPVFYFEAGKYVQGTKGCYSGPTKYRTSGYLEGAGGFLTIWWGGSEVVYDFATMERQKFLYFGPGVNDSVLGGGVAASAGIIAGFRSDRDITKDYAGPFFVVAGGSGIDVGELWQPVGLGAGLSAFVSWEDIHIRGVSAYIGGGLSYDIIPFVEAGVGIWMDYYPTSDVQSYVTNTPNGKKVNRGLLFQHISSGDQSPWPFFVSYSPTGQASRTIAISLAIKYADVYDKLQNEK